MRLVDDIRRCGKGLCAAEKGPGPVHSERRARALCENFRDARLGVPFAGRVRERGRARSCWYFGAEANRLFRLLAASSVARRFLDGTKSLPERGDSPAACSGRPSRRDSFSGGSPPQPSGRGRNYRHVGARSRAPIQNQNRSYVSVPVLPRLYPSASLRARVVPNGNPCLFVNRQRHVFSRYKWTPSLRHACPGAHLTDSRACAPRL